jgi:hypothetical protein
MPLRIAFIAAYYPVAAMGDGPNSLLGVIRPGASVGSAPMCPDGLRKRGINAEEESTPSQESRPGPSWAGKESIGRQSDYGGRPYGPRREHSGAVEIHIAL